MDLLLKWNSQHASQRECLNLRYRLKINKNIEYLEKMFKMNNDDNVLFINDTFKVTDESIGVLALYSANFSYDYISKKISANTCLKTQKKTNNIFAVYYYGVKILYIIISRNTLLKLDKIPDFNLAQNIIFDISVNSRKYSRKIIDMFISIYIDEIFKAKKLESVIRLSENVCAIMNDIDDNKIIKYNNSIDKISLKGAIKTKKIMREIYLLLEGTKNIPMDINKTIENIYGCKLPIALKTKIIACSSKKSIDNFIVELSALYKKQSKITIIKPKAPLLESSKYIFLDTVKTTEAKISIMYNDETINIDILFYEIFGDNNLYFFKDLDMNKSSLNPFFRLLFFNIEFMKSYIDGNDDFKYWLLPLYEAQTLADKWYEEDNKADK